MSSYIPPQRNANNQQGPQLPPIPKCKTPTCRILPTSEPRFHLNAQGTGFHGAVSQILGETKTFFFENKQMNGFSNKTQKHGTGVVHDLGIFLLSSIMRHVLIPNHWYFCMEVLQGLSTTRLKLRSEANS